MKYLIASIMAICLVAFAAYALPPADYPPALGWGRDCSDWTVYSIPMPLVEAIYDPLGLGSGHGFHLCPGCTQEIPWPALDVQMWIEMECTFSFDETAADIHLASYYDDFCVDFRGHMNCNSGQWIIVNHPPGQSLDAIPFVEDIFGRINGEDGRQYGTAIGTSWHYILDGSGPWSMTPGEGTDLGDYMFLIEEPCAGNFTIELCFDMNPHQADGYYTWGPGGYLCPAEPL